MQEIHICKIALYILKSLQTGGPQAGPSSCSKMWLSKVTDLMLACRCQTAASFTG